MRTKQIHYFSGITLSLFILLHVVNHLFALGGTALHQQVMQLLRKVYRFPPFEILLLSAVVVQIISGILLVFKWKEKKGIYGWLQIISGLYLSFFMIYHVRAVLLGRYVWQVETDFHFAAGVVKAYPSKLFFIPYYLLSIICVFVHIGCVHYSRSIKQQGSYLSKIKASTQSKMIMGIGVLLGCLIVAALLGYHL
jgi:hypothetical protein